MTHCCSKTGLWSCHVSFNLRENYRILSDIFCIKPLQTNCLVCHILPCFIAFKTVTYIPTSDEGHLGSKELICQFSCFQWIEYCVCFDNCCLRRFPYIHNVVSCTWQYHMWRLCDVTCDIIMPGKSADSGPDMTLRMRCGCSWTPYWHQSSSRLCFFYWPCIFLRFCCYLVTLCFALFFFVVLPCVLCLHRCGIIMRHNKPHYFKPGLQCCCNLQQWSNHIIEETITLQFILPLVSTENVIPFIPFSSSLRTQYFGSQALKQASPVIISYLSQSPARPVTGRRCYDSKTLSSSYTDINRDETADIPRTLPLDLGSPPRKISWQHHIYLPSLTCWDAR